MTDCSHHPQIYTSWDMDQLLAEIQKAQSLLDHIQALRHSAPGEELTSAVKEVGGMSKGTGTVSQRHSAGLTCLSDSTPAEAPTP